MNRDKISLLWILLATFNLFLGGCTHEDNRHCPQGLYIRFVPDNPGHNYPEVVRTADLYFYDADGQLVQANTYTRDELRAGDRAAFVPDIRPGQYVLVAIINGNEIYHTHGGERLSELQTELPKSAYAERLIDLFSGHRSLEVTASAGQQEETMKLVKHTNDIHLKVIFQGYALPENAFLSGYLGGSNGIFHYESYRSTAYRTYLPYRENTEENPYLTFDFNTFRLWHGSDMTLHLREEHASGEVSRRIELDIEAELAKVRNDAGVYLYDTNEKLEFYDQYEIVLTIGPNFLVIGLQINDWSVIGGGVEV